MWLDRCHVIMRHMILQILLTFLLPEVPVGIATPLSPLTLYICEWLQALGGNQIIPRSNELSDTYNWDQQWVQEPRLFGIIRIGASGNKSHSATHQMVWHQPHLFQSLAFMAKPRQADSDIVFSLFHPLQNHKLATNHTATPNRAAV